MRWHGTVAVVSLLFAQAFAVFQDEAYSIDYQHSLFGLPLPHTTFFHKPQLSSNASLLYTFSEKAVLGAVNPRDGSLVWRQTVLDQPSDLPADAYIATSEGGGQITTAYQNIVTAWEASNGKEVWTYTNPDSLRAVGLERIPASSSSADTFIEDVILLSEQTQGYLISRLSGTDGGSKWSHVESNVGTNSELSIATSLQHVYLVAKSTGVIGGQKTRVLVLDIETGRLVKEYSVSLEGDSVAYDGLPGATVPFLVAAKEPYTSLVFHQLGNPKTSTLDIDNKGEKIRELKVHSATGSKSDPHFLVHVVGSTRQWAEIYHIDTATGDVSKAYSLPATEEVSAFSASSNGNHVYFTRVTNSEVSVYSSTSHGHLGRWQRNQLGLSISASSTPVFASAEVATGATVAVRVAVLSPEGTWYLIRNGDSQWWRPEMLAYTTSATFLDDIDSDALAQELGVETSIDPATAYITRLYRHTKELVNLPQYLMAIPSRLFKSSSDEAAKRQRLVGSKSVVAVTSKNYLFSLDASTGRPKWHKDLSEFMTASEEFRSISAKEGRVTLYTSSGAIVVVNAATGELLDHKAGTISVDKLIELPGSPANTIIKVDADGVPEHASDFAPSSPNEGNTIITLSSTGEAMGWTVGASIEKLWSFRPSDGSRVVDVVGRPDHDPIASIGRILGDRSVLYKYISPNIAILTATSPTSLTIYVVDSITGTLLHTSHHPDVLSAIPHASILSENWFAYTFTTSTPETGITHNLIVSELFESSIPNDRPSQPGKHNASISSFDPSAVTLPYVISAAFTLTEPLTSFAVTQTAQGITTRQLLAYLSSSHTLIGLPRYIIDSRRPTDRDPTPAEAEEGLFRYSPDLTLDPKLSLSHSRDVLGVHKILTAPTLLESTSMVFAFGHDVFGTQVAPSQTFDVLGKNFNKVQLIITVVALYIGVVAIRPVVRKTMVNRSWL